MRLYIFETYAKYANSSFIHDKCTFIIFTGHCTANTMIVQKFNEISQTYLALVISQRDVVFSDFANKLI